MTESNRTSKQVIADWGRYFVDDGESLLLVKELREIVKLDTDQVAGVLKVLEEICRHCWDDGEGCRCWDDS